MKHSLVILLLLLLLAVGCNRRQQLLRAQLSQAELLVETDADSAYALMMSVDGSWTKTPMDSAILQLLAVQTAWKSYHPLPTSCDLYRAISCFEQAKDTLHLGRALYYQGVIEGEAGDTAQQLSHYLQAARWLNHSNDARYKGIVNDNIAYCYRQRNDNGKAKRFDEIAIQAAWTDCDTDAVIAYTMNSLSFELQYGLYDEADSICRSLLNDGKSQHLIHQRLAQIAFKRGDFSAAFSSATNYLRTAPAAADSMYAYQLLRYYYANAEDEYENYLHADQMVRVMAERAEQPTKRNIVVQPLTHNIWHWWTLPLSFVVLAIAAWFIRSASKRRQEAQALHDEAEKLKQNEDINRTKHTDERKVVEAVVAKFVMPSSNKHQVSGEIYWKSIIETYQSVSRKNRYFIEKLRAITPALSNREMAMCVLYESEEPTDDEFLRLFEFTTSQSLRTAKSRLRKKLQSAATDDDEISALLKKI